MTTSIFLHHCSSCRNWHQGDGDQFVCITGKTPPDGFSQPPCYDLDEAIEQADSDVGEAIRRRAAEIRAQGSSLLSDLLLVNHANAVWALVDGREDDAKELIDLGGEFLARLDPDGQFRLSIIPDHQKRSGE